MSGIGWFEPLYAEAKKIGQRFLKTEGYQRRLPETAIGNPD